MSTPRFFIDKEYREDNIVHIVGEENTHLYSALRMGVGDKIEVCFNDGLVYLGEITELDKRETIVQLYELREEKSTTPITLFMALISADRMDWAVQKVTELGVHKIVPFESKYCTVKAKQSKKDRLTRIAVSACKQSGRARIPDILEPIPFKDVLKELKNYSQIVLAYENEKIGAKDVLVRLDKDKPIAIVVGCEGGFTLEEIKALQQIGAKSISLGNTILRAETASVALLSALKYELGEWTKE